MFRKEIWFDRAFQQTGQKSVKNRKKVKTHLVSKPDRNHRRIFLEDTNPMQKHEVEARLNINLDAEQMHSTVFSALVYV